MKVNSLVSPKESLRHRKNDRGVGVVVQTKQTTCEETIYCLVEWTHEAEWWNSSQLVVLEDSSRVSD